LSRQDYSLYTALGCVSLVGFMSTALIFTAKLLIFIAVLIFIAQAHSTRKSMGMRLILAMGVSKFRIVT